MSKRIPATLLISCKDNALRSPMAEAMMKHQHGHNVFVDSLCVRDGTLDGFDDEVMAYIGLDMTRHRPKTFDDLEDTSFDLIISLSPEAQHGAVELTRSSAAELELWHTFDPSVVEGGREARLTAYRQVRDRLMDRIRDRFRANQASDT
jgi:protein-tyrosine-phosphatase